MQKIFGALALHKEGFKNDGTPRKHLGDILHSKPSVVAYGDKEVIFFGTNEGYLHAINAADASSAGGGKELFAFMPSVLLSSIQGQSLGSMIKTRMEKLKPARVIQPICTLVYVAAAVPTMRWISLTLLSHA